MNTVLNILFLLSLMMSVLLLMACQSQPMPLPLQQGQQILVTFKQETNKQAGLINSFSNNYSWRHYGASLTTQRHIDTLQQDYGLVELEGWLIKPLNIYCSRFVVKANTDPLVLIDTLKQDDRIDSAQLLHSYTTRLNTPYNDPYFQLQYGPAQQFVQRLHQWSTGKGVDVAIIDTGIDTEHPELRSQISTTQAFVNGDAEGVDKEIHGTAMAGIIAAQANNGSGIVGLAPEARIWALKACRQLHHHSSVAHCDSFTLAKALSYAVDRRIDVINLSLSGPYDPLVERLINAALARRQLIVAADPGAGSERYPAILPGVIAAREAQPGFSEATETAQSLVVIAPRTEVLSTGPGGGYDFFSGSSVSAAIVSGLATLLHEKNRQLPPRQRVHWLNQMVHMDNGPIDVSLPGERSQEDSAAHAPVAGR